MPLESHGARLANQLIEHAFRDLEMQARTGHYNWLCLGVAGEAARMLEREDLVALAVQLLRAAPAASFWTGAITNLDKTQPLPERMRTIAPRTELEAKYRCYQEAQILQLIRVAGADKPHIAYCLERHYDQAFACASSEHAIEEISQTQAFLGDIDLAKQCIRDRVTPISRQKDAWLVVIIELFRRNWVKQAQAIFSDLESTGLDPWDRISLALGFAEFEPWDGYPYADY